MDKTESVINDKFDSLELSENDESLEELSNDMIKSGAKKKSYKDRKLDHKLNKYEAILKKLENINRVTSSQFLFVGNCGLDNNISSEFLEDTFSKYGKVIDIVMPKKKSYSFIIYECENSTKQAIENLQSEIITCNQTPILFYLFPVDRVPEISYNSQDYEDIGRYPDGLIYLENYIDQSYADKIIEFIFKDNNNNTNNNEIKDLKKRKVKHYGYEFRYGSNDCDDTKQLNDQDNKLPLDLLDDIFKKMLNDKLISEVPDQLTVNIYEPGNGIAPHIDNVNAFNEYIISLSLMSSCLMEFRQKEEKKLSKLFLKPNSLLVLKGESRYKWNHSIPERKHDLIKTSKDGQFIVEKREKRISLTFRKLLTKYEIDKKKLSDQKVEEKPKVELILPSTEHEARQFEHTYVHNIYNQIADHFSHTRHSAWPGVAKFIESMNPYSFMLDVGCGNGKYLNLRKDLFCFGCDYSDQLIRICYERNFNCFVSDILSIPCKNEYFDYVICIAVLHHLSTQERRIKAINEIIRTLKIGGKALITVWAKEQKYKDKESYYISKKSGVKADEDLAENDRKKKKQSTSMQSSPTPEIKDSVIHNYGKEFEKKDLFVAWNYNPKTSASKQQKSENESSTIDKSLTEPKQFLRFYHVFENSELESLFNHISNAKVVESFYEQGNWCAIFEKI